MSKGLPQVFVEMAERYDARYSPAAPFDPVSYFSSVERKIGYMKDDVRESITLLCQATAVDALVASDEFTGSYADQVFDEHAEKHGFEGTLILSLIERVSRLPSRAAIVNVKEKLRRNRRKEPRVWELMRNFGKPTVPKELLPVFAVFEAEKRLGKPLERLTENQMRVIGL